MPASTEPHPVSRTGIIPNFFSSSLVETSSTSSNESLSDLSSVSNEHKALDFKLIVDDVKSGQQVDFNDVLIRNDVLYDVG
jgi:hypothetical protein